MNTTAKRTSRKWVLPALTLLILAGFVGIMVAFWQLKNRDFVNEKLQKELESAKLRPSLLSSQMTVGWPQWRGPNRDGVATEQEFHTDWPENGPGILLAWEKPIGKGYSSVAIADGRLYTMSGDGKKETVYCLDANNGTEIWRFEYPCEHDFTPDHPKYGPGPRSTPSVDGDRVYTIGLTGIMHCLETKPSTPRGEVVWKRDLLKEFKAENTTWGISFSPLVLGDLVYTNPGKSKGHSLVALNKYNGEVKWHNLDDPGGYSSPVAAELAGKKQIIFFTGSGIVGVDPDTGEVYWRFDIGNHFEVNAATPIAVGDYVFASSGYGTGCVLLKIEANTDGSLQAHKVYQNIRMKNHFPSSIYYEDHLYGFDDETLKCLEFRTGKVCWKEGHFGKGSLLIANEHLIILSDSGQLVLAEANPKEFKIKAGFQALEGRCWTVPVMVDGRLYLRNESKIMCLDLRKEGE